MTKRRAVFELLGASVFWGFGFVAVEWALQDLHPFWILFIRYFLAALFGLALHAVFFHKKFSIWNKEKAKLAIVPGILLGLVLLFQTWGMVWTTATNSGFITCLYLLMVPILEWLAFRRKAKLSVWVCSALGLLGAFLISGGSLARPNWGDVLTLICAVLAAVHIVWIGHISNKIAHDFLFNVYQIVLFVPILVLATPFVPAHEGSISMKTAFSLLSLALGSSVLGFFIQVRAQKVLSNFAASLIFILESPFSAVFAFLLLGERLSPIQWAGAIAMMAASVFYVSVSRSAQV